ncbi:MAG TPA: dTDP-4-dehydrorhamnose 3,5-epimerase family protein [Actinomycetota bacterium]|nr:dTDP-4-dehydrorhamnose 3,5-epimerase family protein [Actinomycetota bacterium]
MSRIDGVVVTPLERHDDERGFFSEIARFAGYRQANHSRSRRGVLRGLHYHLEQADLWYVVRGSAQVALVDLRGDEPLVETITVDEDAPCTIYVPPRVAHGFLALTDVDLVYLVTHEYDASDEHGVAWDDPALAIPWALPDPVLSERDRSNPRLDA